MRSSPDTGASTAASLQDLTDMPCIVREMDNDTATILMVDSNIQREDILPVNVRRRTK